MGDVLTVGEAAAADGMRPAASEISISSSADFLDGVCAHVPLAAAVSVYRTALRGCPCISREIWRARASSVAVELRAFLTCGCTIAGCGKYCSDEPKASPSSYRRPARSNRFGLHYIATIVCPTFERHDCDSPLFALMSTLIIRISLLSRFSG